MAKQSGTVTSFDKNQLVLTSLRKNKAGRLTAYVNNKSVMGKTMYRTPVMRTPFPTQIKMYDNVPRSALTMALDNVDESSSEYNEKIAEFRETLLTVENLIIDAASKDSINWIGKDLTSYSMEERRMKAREHLHSIVKEGQENPRGGFYSDLIRMKLSLDDAGLPQKPGVKFNDTMSEQEKILPVLIKRTGKRREAISPENVVPMLEANTRVKLTWSFGGVWFTRTGRLQKYGITLNIEAIEIFPYERVKHVVDLSKFDIDKLNFPETVKNTYGAPQVRLNYENK